MNRLKPAIAAAAFGLCATSSFAWNNHGHMVVAAIAYESLLSSPKIRAKVDALIQLNPSYPDWVADVPEAQRGEVAFLMASRWPDAIKRDSHYVNDGDNNGETPIEPVASQNIGYEDLSRHKYWHYKDVGFSTDGSAIEEAKVPNVETTITLFRSTLALPTASAALKSYDLTWLIHLVGDVHQPLHATSRFTADLPHGDIGGNTVALCEFPCRDELHALWDGALGKNDNPAEAIKAAEKIARAPHHQAAISDVTAWVTESLEVAKADVYRPPIGASGRGPYTLDDAYRAHAKEVAEARVALAGARLAHLLREALK